MGVKQRMFDQQCCTFERVPLRVLHRATVPDDFCIDCLLPAALRRHVGTLRACNNGKLATSVTGDMGDSKRELNDCCKSDTQNNMRKKPLHFALSVCLSEQKLL